MESPNRRILALLGAADAMVQAQVGGFAESEKVAGHSARANERGALVFPANLLSCESVTRQQKTFHRLSRSRHRLSPTRSIDAGAIVFVRAQHDNAETPPPASPPLESRSVGQELDRVVVQTAQKEEGNKSGDAQREGVSGEQLCNATT